jgi:hypothetical protein
MVDYNLNSFLKGWLEFRKQDVKKCWGFFFGVGGGGEID